jgi:hypothetical protein
MAAVFGLDGTLAALAPWLSPALVSGPARRRLQALARPFPAALPSWLYCECRLASGAEQVDLSLAVDACAAEVLHGVARAGRPDWRRLREFAAGWSPHRVARLWLEFDAPAPRAPPGVFLEFPGLPAPRLSARIIAQLLAPLRGASLPPGPAGVLERCIAALPAQAGVRYTGLFPSRGTPALRLCLTGLREGEVAPYLATIGWPGDPERLRQDTGWAGRAGVLNLDLWDGVGPRVGLEYMLSRRPQVGGELREGTLLDQLVDRGLSTVGKRQALALWPGALRLELPHTLWPALVLRRVNHIKLVYTPGSALTAKAYLAAGLRLDPLEPSPTST